MKVHYSTSILPTNGSLAFDYYPFILFLFLFLDEYIILSYSSTISSSAATPSFSTTIICNAPPDLVVEHPVNSVLLMYISVREADYPAPTSTYKAPDPAK